MKKRVITGFCIFLIMNCLICLLFKSFSYFTVLQYFDFYNQGDLNFVLLLFNIAYVLANILSVNSLIEEKTLVGKYIQVRGGRKKAAVMHIVRLVKEVSLIAFTKIVSDFIFWLAFDRVNIKYFACSSLLIYITVLLWLMIFDCLSNLRIKNNILILFFISAIYLSYLLFRYNSLFSLLIIKPLDVDILLAEVILMKIIFILLFSFIDLIVKSKKEYY